MEIMSKKKIFTTDSHLHSTEYAGSLPTLLEQAGKATPTKTMNVTNNNPVSSSFDWTGQNGWRNESQRRWSMATQKVKNLLAATDALNTTKKKHNKGRTMSVEQKTIFLDKFSTRERRFSGVSFDPRRRETGHEQYLNIESNELKDLYADLGDSKSNVVNYSDSLQDNKLFRYFYMLFEPYSTFIYFWSWILITAIHYNSWIIIFRIAFPDAQRFYPILWYAFDYTADFIYFIDILISSRITFLEDGIYVDTVKRVTIQYFKSRTFLADAVCLIPLDILYLFYSVNPAYRLPRLIKFFRVFQAKKLIESMTNIPNLLRGIFWVHIMFLLMHYNSCFFYIISEYEGFGINDWVYPKLEGIHQALTHRYIQSLYWSTLVLTAIGESTTPETTIECIYMIVCFITGIFIFATIVGQAGNVIQNMNASRMEFEKQRDNTMQYMKGHNVPRHLQKRVRLWYDYTYSRGRFNGGDDINEVTMLPDKMKTELALHVHLETLRKVSFLQKCQPEFLHDLVLKMKLHIFTPGDFIVRKGEIAREMYVISDGIAEVVSDNGRVLKVLRSGDFFGEIGLLSLSAGQNRRTADVRSCGYLELFVLNKGDVMSSIRDYPDAQHILAKHGRKRLALGSKPTTGGPRDQTTSSSSDSEIELKITRPDSERSGKYFNVTTTLPNNGCFAEIDNTAAHLCPHLNHFDINEENVIRETNLDDKINNNNSNNYLTSPRDGFFVSHSSSSTIKKLSLDRSPSMSSTRNVIGPASSMKSLDVGRLSVRRKKKFSSVSLDHANKNTIKNNNISGDENHVSVFEKLLKPRKTNIRRSNSDIQRRTNDVIIGNSQRSVFSDGERQRKASILNISETEETIINKHCKDVHLKPSEEKFVKSMRSVYADMTEAVKKKGKEEIKSLKRKISQLERRNVEQIELQEQQEQELRKELQIKEDEIFRLTNQLKQSDHQYRIHESRMIQQLKALEKDLVDQKKRMYDGDLLRV